MTNFIAGTVFGIIVGTVGFNGLATMLNGGVQQIQQFSINTTQK